jgi:hypothetical protein
VVTDGAPCPPGTKSSQWASPTMRQNGVRSLLVMRFSCRRFRGEWSSESSRMWTLIATTLVFAGSAASGVANVPVDGGEWVKAKITLVKPLNVRNTRGHRGGDRPLTWPASTTRSSR